MLDRGRGRTTGQHCPSEPSTQLGPFRLGPSRRVLAGLADESATRRQGGREDVPGPDESRRTSSLKRGLSYESSTVSTGAVAAARGEGEHAADHYCREGNVEPHLEVLRWWEEDKKRCLHRRRAQSKPLLIEKCPIVLDRRHPSAPVMKSKERVARGLGRRVSPRIRKQLDRDPRASALAGFSQFVAAGKLIDSSTRRGRLTASIPTITRTASRCRE